MWPACRVHICSLGSTFEPRWGDFHVLQISQRFSFFCLITLSLASSKRLRNKIFNLADAFCVLEICEIEALATFYVWKASRLKIQEGGKMLILNDFFITFLRESGRRFKTLKNMKALTSNRKPLIAVWRLWFKRKTWM